MPKEIITLKLHSASLGNIVLTGDITHKTVLSVLNDDVFASAAKTIVDFSGVNRADSSGLALMIHWARQAKNRNKAIFYVNVPQTLLALANMSGLESIISISAKQS